MFVNYLYTLELQGATATHLYGGMKRDSKNEKMQPKNEKKKKKKKKQGT